MWRIKRIYLMCILKFAGSAKKKKKKKKKTTAYFIKYARNLI
jgi:hypothetical protein